MAVQSHLGALVINVEAPRATVVLVGDLKAVGVVHLLRLKRGVEVLYGDDSFRAFGFLDGGGHADTSAQRAEDVGPGLNLRTHVLLVVVGQSKLSLNQHKLPLQILGFLFPFLPQHAFIET